MHIQEATPQSLVNKAANELKQQKLIEPTAWSKFVKTGHHKERLPESQDWWYTRAAAILRTVAIRGPIGTEKLRYKYGGKKNRGHKPDKFFKSSGSIIRKILQQLETSGLVEQTQKGNHKGRVATKKGISLLDKIAVQLTKNGSK
jgi:small subunit ribosomal protein S19e